VTNLERLQTWYVAQCDGDWEHTYGITIFTLDNPGWTLDIELNETELEERPFEGQSFERSEDDWLFAKRDKMKFKVACGPRNLDEAMAVFCDWAERSREGD
jgi:hypothetical protein